MGKTRKNKSKAKPGNPVGIPSMRDFLANEELNSSGSGEGPINAIRDQLLSASIDEKMCGLQAIAFLSLSEQKANSICESEIIKIAAPLLMDSNKNVRNATAGAFRNISMCSLDICENLVEQDVLTPLLTLVNEFTNAVDWAPVINRSVPHVEELDVAGDTFLHAVNLVRNLCESTQEALNHFNQTSILESFVRFLNYTVYGIDICKFDPSLFSLIEKRLMFIFTFAAVAVAQCLLVISEDNPVAWAVLNRFAQDIVALITNAAGSEQNVVLRTVAASILANVPDLCSTYINQIFDTLNQALNINQRTLLGQLTSSLPLDGRKEDDGIEVDVNNEEHMEEESEQDARARRRRQDLPTETDIEIKNVGWVLEAQRIAAQTISNLSSTDDDSKFFLGPFLSLLITKLWFFYVHSCRWKQFQRR